MEAASTTFRDHPSFFRTSDCKTIPIYAFPNVFKTHFNLKVFLYKKINHGYSMCFQSFCFPKYPLLIFFPIKSFFPF